ncbi:MAG: hypothetical protein V6Z89_23515 [Desulfobacter sp.]
MQINGYNNVLRSYNLKPRDSIRGNDTSGSELAKNTTETTATTKNEKLTDADEMDAFKKAIHKEIDDIYGNASPALLSNSVHITDGAFERMKSDPEFKSKMMDILRRDASASHQLPYGVHVTTTIDENGYSSYGANVYNNDSQKIREDKKDEADKKAEGAFYHKSTSESDRVNVAEVWLESIQEQEMFERIQQTRNLLQGL